MSHNVSGESNSILDIGTGEGIAIVLYYLSSGDENKMFAT